ncbi:MAG: hypothetical protein WBD83_25585 [Xanthobacteraceae bacterium]
MLVRQHRSIVLAAFAAVALAGCSSDIGNGQSWFAKPFDISGRSAGYSFSELSETKKDQRQITPNDLVNANGSCPAPVAAAAPAPAPTSGAGGPTSPAAAPGGDASSLVVDGGVGLGMSECDVVSRAGHPSSVQIGSTPGGDRTAVLTFDSGPRAGIYRFLRGGLMEMDAVAAPAPPPQVAKKKPAKPKKAASN